MRRLAAAVVPALCVASALACSKTQDRKNEDERMAFRALDVGTAVPTYAAQTITGDTVRVGGVEPPTVLNVWATWCVSCQEEMAALDSLKHRFASQGVRVIAVSVDKTDIDRIRRFAETNHLDMTVAHDPSASINQTFQVVGVPSTFVIGPDGKLIWRRTGNIIDVMPDVINAVQKSLGNAKPGN
ncbi:MAG TPA: TlpA disulfide reductase family protein [Gemmatimonadaceae bacterium]